ncbi:hypothetical protein NM208_g14320 [Fusarium decemcellulare]|uniref:Uncharacterized protein n=1 Tax=Fusarium decemcellulare TaxID=57161 RepID=A0ACC1RHX9_9HYPO|nr:hypothetical protein NM208_g14320 [Fusarium decemcellulare]
MARGEATQTKVHYKGSSEDFLVFVDDVESYKKWQSDKSVPLAHFVSSFKIFLTHGGQTALAHTWCCPAGLGLLRISNAFQVVLRGFANPAAHSTDDQVQTYRVSWSGANIDDRQGAQGTYDTASKASLENEFGTSVDDDIIKQILEKGDAQTTEMPERQGPKNDSKGPMAAH